MLFCMQCPRLFGNCFFCEREHLIRFSFVIFCFPLDDSSSSLCITIYAIKVFVSDKVQNKETLICILLFAENEKYMG